MRGYPDKYLQLNRSLSKQLAIVLDIDGVGTFGVADTFTAIKYGDPGLIYGLPGVVYGGKRSMGTVKPYMMLDGGLTIQQRIEPEQGKGNIGVLTISLIDPNGEVSRALSPGQKVPEPMGVRCRLWLGYTESSYPEDYVLVYQGLITQLVCPPGKVQLQISDSSLKSRQPLFSVGKTALTAPLPATGSSAAVMVGNTGVLHQQILGPDGNYDPTVSTYIVVDSEIMEYSATGIVSDTQVNCTRAALGSQIDAHDIDAGVAPSVGFGFNPEGINALEFALKIMLSGWAGPAITGINVASFVFDLIGSYDPNLIVLDASKDADRDLGLTVGDYFETTGATVPGNNVSGRIVAIETGWNGKQINIRVDQALTNENPATAQIRFRSQYDTFPTTCALQCYPYDVDVFTFQQIKTSFFSTGTANLRGYYTDPVSGIDLIATDIMLPIGSYSVSRHGRLSMSITRPPLPGAGAKLVQLDHSNVLDPDKIVITRATNQRSFYNQISYEFDYDFNTNQYGSIKYFLDTASLSKGSGFGYAVALPIEAKTVHSELGGALLAQQRGTALLKRYSKCLVWIDLTVNWAVGSVIEVSDIILLKDNGDLKIMNFETGERDMGVQLFEVIDRNYQITTGNVRLKLLGGLNFDLTARSGLWSPSSILNSGCTTSKLKITPSYGQPTLAAEMLKWSPQVGLPVLVHDPLWTYQGTSVITAILGADGIELDPPLGFTPAQGDILDIASYPSSTDKNEDAYQKRLYDHFSPSFTILSAADPQHFTVATADAARILSGSWVMVRSPDYDPQSGQVTVESVNYGTGEVTLADDLKDDTNTPFTPSSGYVCEGVGFPDGTGSYLFG